MSKLPIRWTETYDAYYDKIKVTGHLGQRSIAKHAVDRKEVSKRKVEIAKMLGQDETAKDLAAQDQEQA